MKVSKYQEVILAENNSYLLATNVPGNVLFQEHFETRNLTKPELKEILGVISTGNFSAYLIKVNNGSILPPDDWSWVERFNLMRLYKAGISRVAYVSPQNIFNTLELEKELKPGKIFRIRIFRKINDAVSWLEKDLQQEKTLTYPERDF